MKEEINNPFGPLANIFNNKPPKTRMVIMIKTDIAPSVLIWRPCAKTTVEEE
jgi:hypothetical protein